MFLAGFPDTLSRIIHVPFEYFTPLAASSTPSTRQAHKGKCTYESYAYEHSNDTQIEFRYFEHIPFYLLVLAITTLLSCYVKIFASFMIG
jgi:hypothetical protein